MRRFALAVAALFCVNATAHHSVPVNFDTSTNVTVSGTLLNTRWVNPHSHLLLEVETADQGPERWLVEWNSINTIRRLAPKLGFAVDDFAVGETITITGYLGRKGNSVFLREVTFADGRHVVWRTRPDGR